MDKWWSFCYVWVKVRFLLLLWEATDQIIKLVNKWIYAEIKERKIFLKKRKEKKNTFSTHGFYIVSFKWTIFVFECQPNRIIHVPIEIKWIRWKIPNWKFSWIKCCPIFLKIYELTIAAFWLSFIDNLASFNLIIDFDLIDI